MRGEQLVRRVGQHHRKEGVGFQSSVTQQASGVTDIRVKYVALSNECCPGKQGIASQLVVPYAPGRRRPLIGPMWCSYAEVRDCSSGSF